jgi:hypothetical protein
MQREKVGSIAASSIALAVMFATAWHATAQNATAATYPSMAPLDQYLMEDRNSEIALARSAAPESISRDAEVLVLGRHGYETAIRGKNGFVCIVQRSWTAPIDDQEDGPDTGWTHESSDDRGHRRRHRHKRIARDGSRSYVLHAFQAGLLERSRRTLASPPNVFLFTNRPCCVGSGSAGFSDYFF